MFIPTIDDVRNYWNERGREMRLGCPNFGVRKYFEDLEDRHYRVESHVPSFAQFGRWDGKKVLVIGCGTGTEAINFAKAGARLTVIDLSSERLAVCRQRFEAYSLKAQFYHGNAEILDRIVPVEQYDLVYSSGVLQYTLSPYRVLESVKKYMSASSELRLIAHSKWSWQRAENHPASPVAHTFSARELHKGLLRDFTIQNLTKTHIARDVSWMPKPLFRVLERFLGWHTLIVASRDIPVNYQATLRVERKAA
jgi:ubiquinone/menaquinone biosynthesis C-methylase UbiE